MLRLTKGGGVKGVQSSSSSDQHYANIPSLSHSKNNNNHHNNNNNNNNNQVVDEDEYQPPFQDLSKSLKLKRDHAKRPIWITPTNLIILEAFSPFYPQAYDFLIDISEPIARPQFFQTYQLTKDSLYAAVAVSRSADSIIKCLNILCKTDVPVEVEQFIRESTNTFGKAKLVLKNNVFFVESQYPDVLRLLLTNNTIANARINDPPEEQQQQQQQQQQVNDVKSSSTAITTSAMSKATTTTTTTDGFYESTAPQEDRREVELLLLDVDNEDEDGNDDYNNNSSSGGGAIGDVAEYQEKFKTVSFKIHSNQVQAVKRAAKEECGFPLLEEYDFNNNNDSSNSNVRNVQIDLRPSTLIRPYQEKSLSKMFGNGRARSGLIVLPCGAGKTLTGITALTTIKKSTVILCINNASVKQWKEQLLLWTTVKESSIKLFTSSNKDMLDNFTLNNNNSNNGEGYILITTYSMVCHSGRRSETSAAIMKSLTTTTYGLLLLDEVHVAPADMFQKVVVVLHAHCKLGLTATLVREDNKIKDLHFLIGPKLYEANWIDLTNQFYLARAQCVEVWCPMTKEFYSEYIRCGANKHSRTQQLLYLLNPRKFRVCEYLVKYHVARGDKIIIFSDDLPALVLYCTLLKEIQPIPYICGKSSDEERRKYLTAFKTSPDVQCIGLSKVGDTALDIPEANVIIQVSSHFGARRQEAQRLGRILRPKANMAHTAGGFNAFFYSLISSDTKESFFSTKRQQYLIDQGYTFKVVQDLADKADQSSVILKTHEQEMSLLHTALHFERMNMMLWKQVRWRNIPREKWMETKKSCQN